MKGHADPEAPRFKHGHLIGGQYLIDHRLALGSVSEVYLARPVGSAQLVALKILLREPRMDEAWHDRRVSYFLREAAVTAQLCHPCIVELIEIGYDEAAGHFMVLEYLPGKTLEEVVVSEGVFSEERARRVAGQLLSALSSAHTQRVAHRDLKPANVQLIEGPAGEDRIKLFDFGIAKLFDSSPWMKALTLVNTLVGTPMWMSPEQCRGHDLDERSDIYAVGALLYYLVTGRPPFSQGSVMAVLNQVLSAEPPPISKVRKDLKLKPISRSFEKAITRALEKDPTRRFLDCDHFLGFLDRRTPSMQLPPIRNQQLARSPQDCPGLLAVRIAPPKAAALLSAGGDLLTMLKAALPGMETEGVRFVIHTSESATVIVPHQAMPIVTMYESITMAGRVFVYLAGQMDEPPRLLVTVGEPTLGLFPTIDQGAPVLDHLHDVLRDWARWTSPPGDRRRGRPTDADRVPQGGVFIPPEWAQEMRQDFELLRLSRGPHSLVQVLNERQEKRGPKSTFTAGELVVDALCGHTNSVDYALFEEALLKAADPIEVMAAIADLQANKTIHIDGTGLVYLSALRRGRVPGTLVTGTERRLAYLRFFALMSKRKVEDTDALINLIENLESAHRRSGMRHWTRLSSRLDPNEAERCLFRALRLAAMRVPNEAVKPLLQALTHNAHRRAELARASRKQPPPAPAPRAATSGTRE